LLKYVIVNRGGKKYSFRQKKYRRQILSFTADPKKKKPSARKSAEG